jgi:hypothetical protein
MSEGRNRNRSRGTPFAASRLPHELPRRRPSPATAPSDRADRATSRSRNRENGSPAHDHRRPLPALATAGAVEGDPGEAQSAAAAVRTTATVAGARCAPAARIIAAAAKTPPEPQAGAAFETGGFVMPDAPGGLCLECEEFLFVRGKNCRRHDRGGPAAAQQSAAFLRRRRLDLAAEASRTGQGCYFIAPALKHSAGAARSSISPGPRTIRNRHRAAPRPS